MTATVVILPVVPRTNADTPYRLNAVQLKRREYSALRRLSQKWGMSLEETAGVLIVRGMERPVG